MTRTDERRHRLALWCDQRLLKEDTLAPLKNGFADADLSIAATDGGRHMSHLVARSLPLINAATEQRKRFQKKRLDIVRLEAARIGTLHVLTHTLNFAGVHDRGIET